MKDKEKTEIEIGDYVRIKQKGIIGKIEQIGVSLFWLEDGSAFSIKEESYKHNKNIIDLIEVGDYVNGHQVHKYNGNIGIVSINELGWTFIAFKDKKYPIESILTKEQFANVEYKVEEDK